METKANYTIVGFFTVLVIAAGFAFVYWMANYGRTGDMAPLLVRIPGSANGLSVGSAVRFNGIQVGSVRGLVIDKSDPNYVVARTQVRTDAPIYGTTKAVLEIQGLTGSAYIELSGGTVAGENLLLKAQRTGAPATIQAEQSSVTNILATADKILRKANDIVGQLDDFTKDARGPLTNTIKNAQTFSKALADNSSGIDTFLKSVSSLSDTIRNLSGRLDSTMASVQNLVDAVDPAQVKDIVANVDRTTKQIAEASGEIKTTLQAFRQTADSYRALGDQAQKTLDHINTVVASIDPGKVGTTLDNVAAASADARRSLEQIAKITAQFDKHTDDIDETLTNVSEMAKKLNAASTRVDTVLAKVNGFLGNGNASSVMSDAKKALDSFRQLADNLNQKVGPIASNLQQFSGSGLKNVEALVDQMRRAASQLQGAISSLEQNPQRLIFGGKDVKQYDGGRFRR